MKFICRCLPLFLLILSQNLHAESPRPVVVVSVPPQKQIIERLAGEYVDIAIMLSPGQSPETFAPTPKQVTSLAEAHIYFEAGVPFEVSWRDSIQAVSEDIQIVDCCESLSHRQDSEPGEHAHLHSWTDPLLAIEMARLAQMELMDLLPEHRERIKQNFLELQSELNRLHMHIEEELNNRQTDYFIISHSALDAFSDRYGLKQLSLETNGREIGLNSLREMILLSRRENIRTLFIIEQYRTPLVANLAKELDAQIVALDILASDYIENMREITRQMARALRAQ